ncbi:zinc protease [Pedobacter steynii]|uniref:Zinc protease n=1 Tax=Pedobacter steynii TaxID=430522 RepID=A0A1G9K447_9SPHI|nr:M16 family metallopeptidase [Pedobacter steynii]NQX38430.1 insulinase family protein [Pedobacter steynii]SDL44013.1 zinc protease [Pedobacter steynii]
MNNRYWAVSGLIVLLASINPVKSQQQIQPVPLDIAVRTGTLANGFTYYIRKNNEPAKSAVFYLVNKVGSILEDDDQQGLAHFMEHMNFNGTTHFPKNELISYLQKVGVSFGADLNAYTSYDETVYQLPIPTDDPSLVSKGLGIMRDWARGALLKTEDINKERGIILEEKRLTEGVSNRLQQKITPVILNNSRYSRRSPIGIDSVLLTSPANAIRRFYNDWYRPNLQALIVVGDVNVDQVEQQIKKQFSDLKNPENERARPDYKIELTGKNQFLLLTDPEVTATELKIVVKHPESKMKTTTDYLNTIKRNLFNQMLTYRLNELAQQPNLPFINVKAGIGNLMGGLTQFAYAVTAKPGGLKESFSITWSLLEQVKRFGFTQVELDQAKTSFSSGLEKERREQSKISSESYVAQYQQLFLNESASPGFDWEYDFVKKELPGITIEDIKSLAAKYMVDINRDILLIAPEKEKSNLPDSATLVGWLAKASSSLFEAYKPAIVKNTLLSKLSKGGKIVSRNNISAVGVQQIILNNGVKIWLKPTTYKNDQILFVSFAPGGINKYADADYPSASNAANVIGGSGLAGYAPNQLSKMLNGKSVSVGVYISDRAQGINGSCSTSDLETALQLIYLRYTAPRKDTVLFDNAVARLREGIKTKYDDPENVVADTIGNVLSGYHYRMSPMTLERLDSISLEKAFDIYKDRFADASDANFVFVGNFNTDSIAPLLEHYLGALPFQNRQEKPVEIHIKMPKGRLTKIIEAGRGQKASVLLVYHGDCKYSEEEGRQLQALSEILSYRLLTSLREKAGEVYSPSVQSSMTKDPDQRFSLEIAFGCAPEHVAHLVKLVEKDIANLQKAGATQDELLKYKAGVRKQVALQRKTNDFWLQYIVKKVDEGEELKAVTDLEKLLININSNSILKASKLYLSGENCIRFVSLPEKNIK